MSKTGVGANIGTEGLIVKPKKMTFKKFTRELDRGKYVYLMMLPIVVYYAIFHYWPMYGILIAFQDYIPGQSFFAGPWVGFRHFISFFKGFYFWRLIRNTFMLNLWGLVFGFPAPIILALLLNEIKVKWYKRTVQTVSYLPHFVAIVVITGIIKDMTMSDGLLNQLRGLFGYEPILFLQMPEYFRTIYVASGIWQGIGWSSIIYLAALSAIDPTLYEAAEIDGAGRFKKMWHITLPGIAPTIIILLIFAVGGMLSSGFEKIMLLYQPLTYETADVVATYVYRKGLEELEYSFASAVGLFNTVINFTLLLTVNKISRKVSETSLW
jgi:putative aldouronate transport system permease protein